jgi:hypothetical protein
LSLGLVDDLDVALSILAVLLDGMLLVQSTLGATIVAEQAD